MSEGVYITKNGIRVMEWNGDLKEYVEKKISNPYHQLRTVCHVEPDVTLKDIINYVYSEPLLSALIGEYSWCSVEAFYKEVNTPTDKKSDLDYIDLTQCIEFNDWGVSNSVSVNGAGPNKEKTEYDDRDYVDNWGIELTPVNEMADTKIRLNPKVSFSDNRNKLYKHEEVDGACFSFLEVISEIFYEISFCGSPSDRDEMGLNLKQAVDEIKSGKAKIVPFEFPDKESIQ